MRFLIIICCSFSLLNAHAEALVLAVASNFNSTMKKLVEDFERRHDQQVVVSYGSTGKLFAQIVQGAPYDLFLAADTIRPQRLIDMGKVVSETPYVYAIGRLVLWSPSVGLVDQQGRVLSGDHFRRLAIANPKIAPYGSAAIAVLEELNLADKLADKLVRGENIAQTFHFVATGNVELGFVALSQTLVMNSPGSSWQVPEHYYPPLEQGAVLIKSNAMHPAAKLFMAYLQSRPAKAIIRNSGYRVSEVPMELDSSRRDLANIQEGP